MLNFGHVVTSEWFHWPMEQEFDPKLGDMASQVSKSLNHVSKKNLCVSDLCNSRTQSNKCTL